MAMYSLIVAARNVLSRHPYRLFLVCIYPISPKQLRLTNVRAGVHRRRLLSPLATEDGAAEEEL